MLNARKGTGSSGSRIASTSESGHSSVKEVHKHAEEEDQELAQHKFLSGSTKTKSTSTSTAFKMTLSNSKKEAQQKEQAGLATKQGSSTTSFKMTLNNAKKHTTSQDLHLRREKQGTGAGGDALPQCGGTVTLSIQNDIMWICDKMTVRQGVASGGFLHYKLGNPLKLDGKPPATAEQAVTHNYIGCKGVNRAVQACTVGTTCGACAEAACSDTDTVFTHILDCEN
ncbi:unnamed protein product [Amoebophrya sp. A120]|nr:unnamed protein product [Amoebophrya sp. A120]|eukprot:GSA120T00019917001.1